MSISVLITTKDREGFLEFVLGRLAPQFRPGDELVVVDDGSARPLSTPQLQAWIGTGTPICLLRNDESRGYKRARNQGLAAAHGEFVLQLDDDSWPVGDQAFDRIEQAMAESPEAGALSFPVHEHWAGGPGGVGSIYPRHRLPDGIQDFAFIGCAVALRRVVVLRAGGYPEYGAYGGEEEALGLRLLRLGYIIAVCHAIRVIHGHEALSMRPAYKSTRQTSVLIELAANRLCCYSENLPSLVARVLGGIEYGRVLKVGGVATCRALRVAVKQRKPLQRPGFRLSWRNVLRWLVVRAHIWWVLRRSPRSGGASAADAV